MSEEIKIGLDPKTILAALTSISDAHKALAEQIEESLGKDAIKSVDKLEQKAETGSNKIKSYFINVGNQIKESLKTAFDLGAVMEGAKFGKGLGDGIKQVFEMERAFDRLNTRLNLSGKGLAEFKNKVGQAVAGTGQKLEDILPGVESAAASGGVKDPKQLADIAKYLGQTKAITGEDTKGVSEDVIGILKDQGKAVNSKNFKDTLDTIEGTRVSGAFGSAGEAGGAIRHLTSGLSPEMLKGMGLDTRKLGGLASMASMGGASGQDVLKHILESAKTPGGKEQINAALGQSIFGKSGQLDVGALGKVDKKRFGKYSESVLGTTTGAEQADLSRFLDSMKKGMGQFKQVVDGSNETATQFETATNNFASKVDKFKEKTKEAGREIGGSVSALANDLFEGKFKNLGEDAKNVGRTLKDNAGVGALAIGATVGVGALAGGAANRLLSKVGGGLLGGMIGGEAAKAAGIQQVFVTNMPLGGIGGAAGPMAGIGGTIAKGAGVLSAGAAGYELGEALGKTEVGGKIGEAVGSAIAGVFAPSKDAAIFHANKSDDKFKNKLQEKYDSGDHSPFVMAEMVKRGMVDAHHEIDKKQIKSVTNPSSVAPRGAK